MNKVQNQNETTKTLLINTVVTLYDNVEIRVILPYYCKDSEGRYYKVISEDKTLKVDPSDGYTSMCLTGTHCYEKQIATAVKVEHDEFMEALELALDNFLKSEEAAHEKVA